MNWKTVFQSYQNPEIGKKGKQVNNQQPQVSQFSLFPPFGEAENEDPKNQNQDQQLDDRYIQTLRDKNISIEELKSFLGEDWDDYKDDPKLLELWVDLLFKNRLIEQGKVPDNFTAVTWCDLCGYVYIPPALVNDGNVLGCPWCRNRVEGLPIPKPDDLY